MNEKEHRLYKHYEFSLLSRTGTNWSALVAQLEIQS
jgi:hypothetical protein